MNNTHPFNRAVVIGSSMAGLLTARVLAGHFQQVILIEKDQLPDDATPRKSVPQGRHLHGLLSYGRAIMEDYFPGLTDELAANGAIPVDMGEAMRWYHFGGYKKQFTSGLLGVLMSRPLLETQIRRRTLQLTNITLRTGTVVRELLTSSTGQCITGIRVENRLQVGRLEDITADLVVDASGRGSLAPRWLANLGYAKPNENQVKVNLTYATRLYKREPGQLKGADLVMVAPEPPYDKRAGLIFPIEGDRWIVTLPGMLNEIPPTDDAGFMAYAKSLCAPDIYETLLKCEPVSEVITYKFPASLRRHYEQLEAFPEGLLVVGDAVCSFNPVFGQGMTSAAIQARKLDELLEKSQSLEGLWKPFFKATGKVVDIPWKAATGEDFRYPEVIGERPPGFKLISRYMEAVHRATQRDVVVYKAFLEVMNMISPPESMLRPAILWRVLKDALKNPHPVTAQPRREQVPVEVPVTATDLSPAKSNFASHQL